MKPFNIQIDMFKCNLACPYIQLMGKFDKFNKFQCISKTSILPNMVAGQAYHRIITKAFLYSKIILVKQAVISLAFILRNIGKQCRTRLLTVCLQNILSKFE